MQEGGGSELFAYYLIQKLEERDITLENVVRKAPTTGWEPRPDEEETDGGYLAAAESGGPLLRWLVICYNNPT